MNNVIEFKSRSNEVVEKHLARYKELKGWDFSGILDEKEIKEMNDEQEWLIIHNV